MDGELIFNIDVMLARRKMTLTELAQQVGITVAKPARPGPSRSPPW